MPVHGLAFTLTSAVPRTGTAVALWNHIEVRLQRRILFQPLLPSALRRLADPIPRWPHPSAGASLIAVKIAAKSNRGRFVQTLGVAYDLRVQFSPERMRTWPRSDRIASIGLST